MVPIFVAQLLWFTLCWLAIALLVIAPRVRALPPDEQVSLWIAPEMFRVLGLGLLVRTISPGMPDDFAIATAIGDATTSVLSFAAFVALRKQAPVGRSLAWVASVVGIADLLVAFPHAMHAGAIEHLHAQYYVPVFAGPIMITAHVMTVTTLVKTR
jgi:hypothetical protein